MPRLPGRRSTGLTLVELMIALLIGAIVLLGIASLFLSSRQTQLTQQHLNRVAEDARFFSEFISKDIRMAGREHDGCSLNDPGLEWSAADNELTIQYCEKGETTPVNVVYRFDSAEQVVWYRRDEMSSGETRLLEGVVFNSIWFGKRSGAELHYEQGDSSDFTSIEAVRLNFELRGDVGSSGSSDDRATPEFEFTVAVRNNLLEPPAAGGA